MRPVSPAGMSVPAAAALGVVQAIDEAEGDAGEWDDNQLCDTVAIVDDIGLLAEVEQDDPDFAAIIRIDGSGAVQYTDLVL